MGNKIIDNLSSQDYMADVNEISKRSLTDSIISKPSEVELNSS